MYVEEHIKENTYTKLVEIIKSVQQFTVFHLQVVCSIYILDNIDNLKLNSQP